jgi:hypothetical protein
VAELARKRVRDYEAVVADLSKRLAALELQVGTLAARATLARGEPGAEGRRGPRGVPGVGLEGPPGPSGQRGDVSIRSHMRWPLCGTPSRALTALAFYVPFFSRNQNAAAETDRR